MKKLLVLFFVAAICVPSYGDILVYKFAGQFNPWIAFTDDSYNEAAVGINRITGYDVVDIDMDTGELNATPTLIFYDGKAKWYYCIDAATGFDGFSIKGTAGRGTFCYATLDDSVGAWLFELYGKNATVDIGRIDKRKVQIPKSLKGVVIITNGGSVPVNAFGNITMTLNVKYTQSANKVEAAQEDVVDKICADLEGKGYWTPG